MKPLNILLADDSEAVGAFVTEYLRGAGHRVTFVQSGEAAVQAYRAAAYDLVLMDVVMPGIGGLEALRRIKAMPAPNWVPVIIITALGGEEDLMSGFLAGADDYILKPFQPLALDLRIRAMMRIAAIQRTTAEVVDSVIEGIIQIDRAGTICRFNKAAESIFGYPAAEVLGRNVNLLMPSPPREQHDQYLANYLATGEARIIGIGREVVGLRKSGESFPMHLGITEATTLHGRYFVGLVRDLTVEQRMRREIEYLATHDALTGLPNRAECWKRLEARFAIRSPSQGAADCSVFYCDLDGFKQINDRCGHAAGDVALQEACRRLQETLFVRDFIARIGGDEFVAIIDGAVDDAKAQELAQRMIEAVSQPIVTDAAVHRLGLSIGIAHARDYPDAVESLVNAADAAMYEAKRRGKGRAVFAADANPPAAPPAPSFRASHRPVETIL